MLGGTDAAGAPKGSDEAAKGSEDPPKKGSVEGAAAAAVEGAALNGSLRKYITIIAIVVVWE